MSLQEDLLARADVLPRRTLAVVAPEDPEVMMAVLEATQRGWIRPHLFGNPERIQAAAQEARAALPEDAVVHASNSPQEAARAAVLFVHSGQAHLLMKGLIPTATLLREVLDEQIGLRGGELLSHVAVFPWESRGRFLLLTDAAMNVAPGLAEKAQIILNAVQLAHALGIEKPKVAALAALETVNPKMPATLDAAALAKMGDRGQLGDAVVDGPLALDNALSPQAAETKGIRSPVAGQADILLAPDLEAGNILYKGLTCVAGLEPAAILLGARAPVVLTSRSDSHRSKLVSLALGLLLLARGSWPQESPGRTGTK
ncbi:MAG: bifunctional enoyl-CoA hydratase/phosphate acetyltransferase [Firmicutes bacterium]|nr:bifunctional enoyl-CoA hydratase/phosphate acetyltransferase [Bacillota bacterium]